MIKVGDVIKIKHIDEIKCIIPNTEFYEWLLTNGGRIGIVKEVTKLGGVILKGEQFALGEGYVEVITWL